MLEKAVKLLFKVLLMVFVLFGVRYVLYYAGIIIPIEWFVIMISGMFGFYGIILIILYAFFINLL